MNVDLSRLKSSGITFLNVEGTEAHDDEATIIVLGVPRSGTTMVAGCLRFLDIFIGDKANNGVNEDIEIAGAIEAGNETLIKEIIQKRNSNYRVWGFKRPTAFKQINDYLKLFQNPKFVIVYRDVAAIAKRNEISMHMDFLRALRLATDDMLELTNFVCDTATPSMIVSYEKSLQEPRKFVKALARFCGTTPSQDNVDQAVNSIENGPSTYLDESRLRFEGRLDQVKDGFALGWARRIGQEWPQTVIIVSGTEIIGRGCANLFRQDLLNSKKENGKCAFRVRLTKSDVCKDDIKVLIEGSRFELNK